MRKRKDMKKSIALLLTCALLTGCGSIPEIGDEAPPPTPSAIPTPTSSVPPTLTPFPSPTPPTPTPFPSLTTAFPPEEEVPDSEETTLAQEDTSEASITECAEEPASRPFTFISDHIDADANAIGGFLYSDLESLSEYLSEREDIPVPENLSEVLSPEEIDTVFSLAYRYETVPQLFARYRGWIEGTGNQYCIDFIQLDHMASDLLINIQIMSSYYRFEPFGESKMLQNIYYYVENTGLENSATPFQLIDLNNDGYQDFLFELGRIGNGKNSYAVTFIYDTEQEEYVFLGAFYTPIFIPEKQMIRERDNGGMCCPDVENIYIISGSKAILMESLGDSGDWEPCYTYIKRIDGVLTTIKRKASYDEMWEVLDIEDWPDEKYWGEIN